MRHFNFYIATAIFFVFIFVYTTTFQNNSKDRELVSYLGQEKTYSGTVVSDPVQKENSKQFVVQVGQSKILLSTDPYQRIEFGERITFSGILEKPENFLTENGRMFDYKNYLAKDQIYFIVRFPKIISLEAGKNSFYKVIYKIKNNFIAGINNVISFPESALASGIVVAGKVALPKNIQNEFIKTGTSQVVVLSGYNVTLIASALASGLVFLPRAIALSLAGAGIVIFSIMAGAGASILRASIMALIAILAKLLRRDFDVLRALLISAMIMLIFNPMLLVFDPSFELSFIATFGLIVFSPVVKTYLSSVTDRFYLKELLAQTIATQIFVTPFLLYLTGNFSLVSLPANVFLFFLTPVAMFLSFIAGSLSIVSTFLGMPFGWIAQIPLFLMLKAVHIFSALPFSNIILPTFSFWLCVTCYVFLGWIIWKHSQKTFQ